MGRFTVMFETFLSEIKESRSKRKIGWNLNNAVNRIEVILCGVCVHVYLRTMRVCISL